MKSRRNMIYTALTTFTALTVTVSAIPMALAANNAGTAGSGAAVTATAPTSVDAVYVMSETNNEVKITESGVYKITGSCSDGNIIVKKGTTGVTLILENLTLTSTTGATLSCNKETETTIYVSGSVKLTDAENPDDENSADTTAADAFDGAAIKVKENASLTIGGTGTLTLNGSAKNGIKLGDGATLDIESGTIDITAENDGINANSDLTLAGGTITVSAGDDGIHSDAGLTVDGADITITKSNEGLEGATIVLNSGSGSITASDDGINAAADGAASSLTINGGVWYINAGGDGLDAGGDSNGDNGTIVINGGETIVFGAANNGNAALDAGRGVTYNGGTLLAVGMSGMAEVPSGGSILVFGSSGMGGGMMGGMPGMQMGGMPGMQMGGMQQGQRSMQSGRFGAGQDQTQQSAGNISLSAGDSIVIKDASGGTVYSATAVKNANSVIFAGDTVSADSEYTLYVNGSAVAAATAGPGAQGGMTQQFGRRPDQQDRQAAQAPQQGQQADQTPQSGRNGQNGLAPQPGQGNRQGRFGQDEQPRSGGQQNNGFGGMQGGPQTGGQMGGFGCNPFGGMQNGPMGGMQGGFGGQEPRMGGMNNGFGMMR